jgi:hypothetical protein
MSKYDEASPVQGAVSRVELAKSVSSYFSGRHGGYFVTMNGTDEVYFTKESRDCDLFKAELKAKILTG